MQNFKQKMKILGVKHYRIMMRNSIQPREYSMGSGMDGASYISATRTATSTCGTVTGTTAR